MPVLQLLRYSILHVADVTVARGDEQVVRSAGDVVGHHVLVVGEPGIGQTQLVRHFRRWAVEQGAVALYGRFFDYRGASAARAVRRERSTSPPRSSTAPLR